MDFKLFYYIMPEDVHKAMVRADVYSKFDFKTCIYHIRSMNLKEPLTDDEKRTIGLYSAMWEVKIVFDN